MKNKSYFGKFSKNKKLVKRMFIFFLILLLIFIPSVLIALNYFSAQDETSEGDEITVSVYSNEELLFSETATKQNALPNSLVSIFDSMLNGLTELAPANADTSSTSPLLITHTFKDYTSEYTCYFFTDGSDRNFLIQENGEYCKIAQSDAMLFLASAYAQALYPSSNPPVLYTSSDDQVIPTSAEWYYKNTSQKYIQTSGIEASEDKLTYDMAGALGIKFNIEPDECEIEVYKSGIIFSKITGYNLSNITVDPGTVLNFRIKATWKQSEASDFYGSIEYNFDAILRDRAEFIVDKTSVYGGEFIVLACTNVLDSNKIDFSSTPDIKFTPRYFESNEMVYALIPFDATLSAGKYSLSFTYGAASESIDITLIPTPERDAVVLSTEKDPYFLNYTSSNALSNFADILDSTSYSTPDYIYFDGEFLDYTQSNANEQYLFNTPFQSTSSIKEYTLYGTVFSFDTAAGATVKAANNGRVISCGYSDHIGSFVVIEHGLGLKTVYGHLGAINVNVGDIVLGGQSIGRTGQINGSDNDSLLVLTYIFDVAVDYSAISGIELPLYVPEQAAEE